MALYNLNDTSFDKHFFYEQSLYETTILVRIFYIVLVQVRDEIKHVQNEIWYVVYQTYLEYELPHGLPNDLRN